jgi:hypothetical protein
MKPRTISSLHKSNYGLSIPNPGYALLSISILSLASEFFLGITFENPTDSSAWPTSVPYGWSVEWDLSPAGSDPPE